MPSAPTCRLGLATLALVVGASGCTRDENVTVKGRTVHVALREYRLDPLVINAHHGRLTIVVRNDGRFPHNLAVAKKNIVYARSTSVGAGQTAVISRLQLDPGTYRLFSSQSDDDARGLYGFLVVT